MKALSVRQPQAALLVLGPKKIECRSWATRHRGLLAIHASLAFPASERERARWHPFFFPLVQGGYDGPNGLPRGAIVGLVEVVECRPVMTEGDLPPEPELTFGHYVVGGTWAWRVEHPRLLAKPIPCRGQLGVWTVPPDVEAAIRQQIEV